LHSALDPATDSAQRNQEDAMAGLATQQSVKLPRPLIEGPSAWFGPDLAQRPEEWT
jgi:hypothetical protein